MSERTQYWTPTHKVADSGADLEIRSGFAWDLIAQWGLVAGKTEREDSAGRAVCEALSPEEVVSRAFAISDAFVSAAEARGEIRAVTETEREASVVRGGELQRMMTDAQYPRLTERSRKATSEEAAA